MNQLLINIGIVTTLFYLLVQDYQHRQWRQAVHRLLDQMKERVIDHDRVLSRLEQALSCHADDISSINNDLRNQDKVNISLQELKEKHEALASYTKTWMEGVNSLNLIHGSRIEKIQSAVAEHTQTLGGFKQMKNALKRVLS